MLRIIVVLLLPLGVQAQSLAERLAKVKAEQYAEAPGYSEGPTWRDGEVFFCSGALLRVDKDRKVSKYLDINPAGTYLKGDGSILICDNKTPALVELTREGKVAVLVEKFDGKKLNSLNDLTVDKEGNVYWTDPSGSTRENPTGKIFRLRPDGNVSLLADNLAFPNGLEVDPESKHLYLIESQTAKVLRQPTCRRTTSRSGRPRSSSRWAARAATAAPSMPRAISGWPTSPGQTPSRGASPSLLPRARRSVTSPCRPAW